MTSFVSRKAHVTIRWVAVFVALTVTTASLLQAANIRSVSADDGGYPWVGATYVDANYDWGYSTCPSNDTGCMTLSGYLNGVKMGEADPWVYNLRNCTSYVAWQINQQFSKNINGWGNAADWDNNATGTGHPYTNDSTPQKGDIAQWNATTSNPYGHVAYVWNVSGTTASLAEYNSGYPKNGSSFQWGLFYNSFTSANYPAGAPSNYIHIGAISSSSYDLRQFYVSNGSWVSFDVSSATGVQINGNPFEDTTGTSWAKDSNGHLRQFYVGSNGWTAFDVSNATGVNIGGDPYVDSSGTVWVRDTNNHLRQFYVSGGSWTSFDVSNATGVNIAGTPIVDSGGTVWARDANGHLRQFYVSGGSWTAFDVSNATGVNIASNVALANGAEFARDTNNHLHQFYVSGSWTAFDVSNATGVNVGANPVADSSGAIWIDDTASHLRQFYVSGSWVGFDVSYAAGNVTITGDPGISSAGNFAEDSNGSLRQFYVSNGSWVAANIGGATGVTIASNPASGTSGEFAEAK